MNPGLDHAEMTGREIQIRDHHRQLVKPAIIASNDISSFYRGQSTLTLTPDFTSAFLILPQRHLLRHHGPYPQRADIHQKDRQLA